MTRAKRSKQQAAQDFYDIAKADGITLLTEYVNALTPVRCICPKGHECAPSPHAISKGGGWCRFCGAQNNKRNRERGLAGEAVFRSLIERAGGSFIGPYKNSHTPTLVVCPRGHECTPHPADVRHGHNMCFTCAGSDKAKGELVIRELALRDGVVIIGPYEGIHKPLLCICPNGHKCSPYPASVKSGQGWCFQCHKKFDRLYLVSGVLGGESWAKVGLASSDLRVASHEKHGWVRVYVWLGLDHMFAWEMEKSVKALLVANGWPTIDRKFMPQGGALETFPGVYLVEVQQHIEATLRKGE